jgi:hypothetical protein
MYYAFTIVIMKSATTSNEFVPVTGKGVEVIFNMHFSSGTKINFFFSVEANEERESAMCFVLILHWIWLECLLQM